MASAIVESSFTLPDDENYNLILQLLLQDVRQLEATSKGKQREGTTSDAELARQLFEQELSNAAILGADRRISRSIQQAVRLDADTIDGCMREERMARYDRAVSIALSKGLEIPPPPPSSPPPPRNRVTTTDVIDTVMPDVDNTVVSMAKPIMYVPKRDTDRKRKHDGKDDDDDDDDNENEDDLIFLGYGYHGDQAESSSWAASRRPAKTARNQKQQQQQRRPCTSCTEETFASQLIQAPCQHEYCQQCLTKLFQSSMADESLFPPKCCRQAIPVEPVARILGATFLERFQEKQVEFSTANRVYCHHQVCHAFIPPALCEDDVAMCTKCGSMTCVHCKRAEHRGVDCPMDHELQRVLHIAQQEGWRRCFRCNAMVELEHGCFHMTCRCKAEFCYVCGREWKTCPCPQWDERRLINRAAEIAQRNNQPQAQPQAQQARRPPMDDIINNLRDNHQCNHTAGWRRVSGRYECESCYSVLRHFIFECSRCHVMACRHCRYNRL